MVALHVQPGKCVGRSGGGNVFRDSPATAWFKALDDGWVKIAIDLLWPQIEYHHGRVHFGTEDPIGTDDRHPGVGNKLCHLPCQDLNPHVPYSLSDFDGARTAICIEAHTGSAHDKAVVLGIFMPALTSHLENVNCPGNADVVCHRSIGSVDRQVANNRPASHQNQLCFILKFILQIAFDLVPAQVQVDGPVDHQSVCQSDVFHENQIGNGRISHGVDKVL